MRWVAIAVVTCGCFHPSPSAGIPCGANHECPGDQICDTRLSPPTCVESLAPEDGGTGDGAPGHDGLIGVDAPPPGACVADVDCAAGICHELTGACVPDAEVLFVAPSGDGTACTRAAPCGSLQAAIEARTQTRYTIALAAGTYDASWDMTPMQANVTNLVVSGPTRSWDDAVLTCSDMNRVQDGVTAIFEGLTIRGGSGSTDGIDNRGNSTLVRVWIDEAGDYGAVSRGGTLRILDSQVTKSTNSGISASGGTLIVERTRVVQNAVYGINADGVSYTIVNSMIANNGRMLAQTGGVRLRPGSSATQVFRFNTLARNQGASYPSITCDSAATISNTIVAEQGFLLPAISLSCSATYSLFNTMIGAAPAGTGNIAGDPMFVSTTDFHLQAGSPAIDKANPMDPEAIDFDGQQRLGVPDIGADELP